MKCSGSTCEHSTGIPGDCHLACKHPILKEIWKRPESEIISLMGKHVGQVACLEVFGMKFNPHGVKSGWCQWPFNFDPIWVDCCLIKYLKCDENGELELTISEEELNKKIEQFR